MDDPQEDCPDPSERCINPEVGVAGYMVGPEKIYYKLWFPRYDCLDQAQFVVGKIKSSNRSEATKVSE